MVYSQALPAGSVRQYKLVAWCSAHTGTNICEPTTWQSHDNTPGGISKPCIYTPYLFVPDQHYKLQDDTKEKHSGVKTTEIVSQYQEIVRQGFRILGKALQPVVVMMHHSVYNEVRFCVPQNGNRLMEVDPETSPQAQEGRKLLGHIRRYIEMYASLFNESVDSLHDNINNIIGVSPTYEGQKRQTRLYDPIPDTREKAEKKINAMLKFLLHARDGLEKSHYRELAKSVGSHIPELLSLLPTESGE